MTDIELLGTPGSGRCMDCKWNNDSAVVKSCPCNRPLDYTREMSDKHTAIIKLAREAKLRRA